MPTEDANDFEQRFREIHRIFNTFHTQFINKNTIDSYEPSAAIILKEKIQYIHEALQKYLNTCLGETATCESTVKDVTVIVNHSEDVELTAELKEVLTKLCPYMFPWNVHMNARVGDLFNKFSNHPFSPVNLDAVPDSDSVTQ